MNPSPSSHSVGSQKPSTATSSASKRTRTIIVARNLPDPQALPPSTASSPSHGRFVGAHHGPRDSKPTKLSSYAALGDKNDLELYERFLDEQKLRSQDGVPLSDGKSAPQFLKTSPKRRSASQASLLSEVNDGSGGVTNPPPTISPEDAADAKQRREAVIQHRKWLKSLPIHERLAYERQQNVIKKWKAINRQWEAFKQRTSKKLGKSEKQLVMSRASEYREQIEMYDALQRAMPLSEKVGGDIWLVSLRNERTRYVPVGNIFSGLYCPIRESSKLQPRVRRPLDYLRDDKDAQNNVSMLPISAVEKRSLEALDRKKRRLKKQLETLYPHEVEPSQISQLTVVTRDLFEWASSSQENDDEFMHDQLSASTHSLLLPLEEGDQENNADVMSSHQSTARSKQSSRRIGPSIHIFTADTVGEQSERTMPQTIDLTFFVDIGVAQQQTLFVENNGTTAIHFTWHREDVANEELSPRLTQDQWSPLDTPTRTTWTFISQRQGIILPDEVIEFVFTFCSKRAGIWLEQWVLHTNLPVKGVKVGEAVARTRLQCTAVDNFVPISQRRRLRHRVTTAETKFAVEQVLKAAIIQRVNPAYSVEFPDLSERARAFYDAHRGGEFETVQYSERFVAEARELHKGILAVLSGSSTPEHDAASSDSAVELMHDLGGNSSSMTPEWNLDLLSLKNLAASADAQLESWYSALKAKQLAERGDRESGSDDEDEDDDLLEKLLGTKARKKEEEKAALQALEPHFVDDFVSLTLAAHISPYDSKFLQNTMDEKLASMVSETPVVYEIAQMLSKTFSPGEASNLLQPLIARALDESLMIDRQRERDFADAKRKFHSMTLAEKQDFRALSRLMPLCSRNEPFLVFLQVDLDIANWFTLVSGPSGSLEWKLSQKLLDHSSQVPAKLTSAASSILQVLTVLIEAVPAPTIVLLSELSTPPMTKAMKKMEVAAARAMAVGGSESEALRQSLAQKRDKALSLRGIEVLLKRALEPEMSLSIEFVESLQSLEMSCKPPSPPATPNADTPSQSTEDEQITPNVTPRIVVMEHLGSLSRQALRKQHTPDEVTGLPSLVASPPIDKAKPLPTTATDKKKSVVGTPTTTTKQANIQPAPIVDQPTEDGWEKAIEVTQGMSLEMMGMQALGRRLGRLGDLLVADCFPQSWWESTLVFFAASQLQLSSHLSQPVEDSPAKEIAEDPKHVLVGPSLMKTFETWGQLFQRSPSSDSPSMKAIVGGCGLERKIRLIDGLIERVEAIYFVGEVAMSFYRVLHTKELIKQIRRERKPIARFESQRLISVVERLMQKAYRMQVELLLPFDLVVGESHLEHGNSRAAPDDEADEDDEEDPDEDGEEGDEDDDTEARKKSKKKLACAKPLPEPAEFDTWHPRSSYDGERAIVEDVRQSWIRFSDFTLETITNFKVTDGKEDILEIVETENDEAIATTPLKIHPIPELEWTQRVLDLGPKSLLAMLKDLQEHRDECNGWIFVNGTPGAVEFEEFKMGTQQLVGFLRDHSTESVLLCGKSTRRWFKVLSSEAPQGLPDLSLGGTSQTLEMANVLRMVVEARPHASLTAFDTI